jgi:cytidylate kinase
MTFTVAIDGPAAAGKGTISKALAEDFGFSYLDTGLLYRAVGRLVLAGEDPVDAAGSLRAEDLDQSDLRTAEVAQAASRVAVISEVRQRLTEFQREFSRRDGGAVLDGRDIGTVICPDADVKLFVTASDQVRAERRYTEMTARGEKTTLEQVVMDVQARDQRDRERATAPMVAAADAVVLDTSEMSIEAAVARAVAVVEAKLNGWK